MKNFLDWLINLIKSENIDLLLITGDIFNTVNPDIQSQELYYNFLNDVVKTNCKNVVITSGNHDSAAFLDASASLLKNFNVHVIGRVRKPEDEVIILYNEQNLPELIICAVPFLHDSDIRTGIDENDFKSRQKALIDGIYQHYNEVYEQALKIRENFKNNIPIIATGHLFITGGHVVEGDGVRELYVGDLVQVQNDLFPDFLSYTALGHLHSRQNAGRENICYSGSPVEINFSESVRVIKKSVNIFELSPGNLKPDIKFIDIPNYRDFLKIRGTFDEVVEAVQNLKCQISTWLEIILTERTEQDAQKILNTCIKDRPLIEIVSIQLEKSEKIISNSSFNGATLLDDFSPIKIFELCLDENNITNSTQREIYTDLYKEILNEIKTEQLNIYD